MLLVLIGKSCSGKDTIAKELITKHRFSRIITTTSRPMRNNEKQDVDYHFISKEEFLERIKEEFFIEYKVYQTPNGEWYYGTSYESVKNLKDDEKYVIILTPDGYRELFEKVSIHHKSIYLYANNSTIMKRLKKRKDKNDSPQRRLEHDNEDFKGIENEVDRIVYNNYGTNINEVINKILKYLEE